jgi:hypothetical protein
LTPTCWPGFVLTLRAPAGRSGEKLSQLAKGCCS